MALRGRSALRAIEQPLSRGREFLAILTRVAERGVSKCWPAGEWKAAGVGSGCLNIACGHLTH